MLSLMPRYTRPSERPMSVTSSHDVKFLTLLSAARATGTTTSENSRNIDMSMRAPVTRASSLCLQTDILRVTTLPAASTPMSECQSSYIATTSP